MTDELTGVWYCPECGYVDPNTRALHCNGSQAGRPHQPKLFEQALRGDFLTIPVAAASSEEERDA